MLQSINEEQVHPLLFNVAFAHRMVASQVQAGDDEDWCNIPEGFRDLSDGDLAIVVCKELEGCLEATFGGFKGNLAESAQKSKFHGVRLPQHIVKQIQYVAHERNKLAHDRNRHVLEARARFEHCVQVLRDFFNDAKHLELLLVARLFDLTLFFERSGEGDFMLLGVKGIVKLFQASNDVFENSLLLGIIGTSHCGKSLIDATVTAVTNYPNEVAILFLMLQEGTAFERRQRYAIDAGAVDTVLFAMQRHSNDSAALQLCEGVLRKLACTTPPLASPR